MEVLNRNHHGGHSMASIFQGGWVVVVNVVVKGYVSVWGDAILQETNGSWRIAMFLEFQYPLVNKFCWLESPHIHIQEEDLYYTPSKDHKRSILSC